MGSLRRFFLHVLPRGFVRIRYIGFLAHRRRTHLLPQMFRIAGCITAIGGGHPPD
jgi:hypothetical protein